MKILLSKCKPASAGLIALFLAVCAPQKNPDPTDYVNPFIGTDGRGRTYPGASLPFGMVQLSPDTRNRDWEGGSGYFYSDDTLYGFSHTHLSGSGDSDYGDILLMPTVGRVVLQAGSSENRAAGYASKFSHEREQASPGYYRVFLDDYGIDVELTATLRAGFHRYIFPQTQEANVIFDLTHWDPVLASSLEFVSPTGVEGMRRSSMWAKDQVVYFSARFSKPFSGFGIAINDELKEGVRKAEGTDIKAYVQFQAEDREEVLVKVGISAVSIEGARRNLEEEIEDWDFDRVREESMGVWNEALNRIKVTGKDREQKIVFYTALYHTLLTPNLFMDADGRYRGIDGKIHTADGFVNYTAFSLWDTFRAVHPLFTLLEPQRTTDFVRTLLAFFENGGRLPVRELAGNDTGGKTGYHAASVIADAYLKGIRGFDPGKALEAIKSSADQTHSGLGEYQKSGYISSGSETESVSKSLEYAYDDWCIARLAAALNKEEDYSRFIRRAQFYKNLFDPSTGFMRAKTGGFWYVPFDPLEVDANYTEANAWQYTFFVPHDMEGLIKLMGGKIPFSEKLDRLFDTQAEPRGKKLEDITGLIGMYAHGNEPSHHLAYLFNYVIQPWKTHQKVREIMSTFYSSNPDGLCGNDDYGQLSAWYVLSALGFYPVCPGQPIYVIGTPLFPEVSIDVGNGKTFLIKAKRISHYNIYIQEAFLNGNTLNRAYLNHSEIVEGGEIVFFMGDRPNKEWATKSSETPPSAVTDNPVLPVPYVKTGESVFQESTLVTLESVTRSAKIYYTKDGREPTLQSSEYKNPFFLNESTTLKMFAFQEGLPRSFTVTARFRKNSSGRSGEREPPPSGGTRGLQTQKQRCPDSPIEPR